MDDDRAERVWASIGACARAEGVPASAWHVCLACARAVGAVGAGLSMSRGHGLGGEPMLATDPASEELEELQFTLGQGPSVDAASYGGPVLVADVSRIWRRWPVFSPAALQRDVRAVFAFPVSAGAARIGVLALYRRSVGALSGDELADALAYADAVLVLALDRDGGSPPRPKNSMAAGFAERRAEVHQATGMVSVQLGVDLVSALARMRAHAFLHDRRLAEVAADVVARRLRFHPDDDAVSGPGSDGQGARDNGNQIPGHPLPADGDEEAEG